jgi:hypothetical protein
MPEIATTASALQEALADMTGILSDLVNRYAQLTLLARATETDAQALALENARLRAMVSALREERDE